MNFKDFLKLDEAKKVTIDIDFADDPSGSDKKLSKKYGITIKADEKHMSADVIGEPEKIINFLTSSDYDMDMSDIKEFFPELFK